MNTFYVMQSKRIANNVLNPEKNFWSHGYQLPLDFDSVKSHIY